MNLGYPARNATITTFTDPNGVPSPSGAAQRQRLVVVPGRFLAGPDGTGVQSLYDHVAGTVYYSTSNDYDPPGVADAVGVVDVDADTVSFSADVSDPSSVKRVFALVDDGSGWRRVELTGPAGGSTWSATTGVPAATSDVAWILQAVDGAGNVTVINDKGRNLVAPPEPVQLSVSDAGNQAEAGAAPLHFTVSLSRPASEPVEVDVATVDGTASGSIDYTAIAQSLTFAPGQTTKPVDVAIRDDEIDEPNETLTLRLFAATGAVIADGSGAGTIVDDDITIHSLSGTVRDAGGNPVRGAAISLVGSTVSPVNTAPDGSYSFPDIPADTYNVRAAAVCKTAQSRTVTVNGATTADFTLAANSSVCEIRPHAWDAAANVLPLTGNDASATVTLPFVYRHYGVDYSTAYVSTNGVVNFAGANTSPSNVNLPNASAPNAALYGFWDDLLVDSLSEVRTQTHGSGADRRFVIEWWNVALVAEPTRRFSFEILLYEDRQKRPVFQYRDIDANTIETGSSATVGKENAAGKQRDQDLVQRGRLLRRPLDRTEVTKT